MKKLKKIEDTKEKNSVKNPSSNKEYIKKGKSGIHIKPENKGKFTATKKATGKSTEELTHSKNPVTKKRAIFAQNAKKWKHEDGGKVSKDYIQESKNKNKKDSFVPSKGVDEAKYKSFPKVKHQKGGVATADSTKYYSSKLNDNIKEHFNAQGKDSKDEAAKKATQTKNSLNRQQYKGKPGYDKNGFPIKKQNGGEMPKGGDQAAAYKNGKKIKQMGGQIYGAAKKGTKIDASKWTKKK